ncbi:MAG: hypothetical protein JNK08_00385 [Sediminibacterium sp.]|nr:hypothetical protein [Sediminibacterium sp.]
MLPLELRDKTIELLSQNNQIFLGWEYGIPSHAVSGYIAGQLLRIMDYNERDRILYLKPDGKAPEGAYRHTFDTYGRTFESMQVARIEISQPRMPVIKQITTASGYTQPISVRYQQPPSRPAPSFTQPTPQPVEQPKPRNSQFTESLTFDIRGAEFDEGTIKFTVKVKTAFQQVHVTLQNPAIRKYFDAIKNYIWKLFGSKKTLCTITFDMVDRKCIPVSVDSCELLQLNETILQRIHDEWVGEVLLSGDRDDILPLDDLIDPIKDETHNGETVFNQLVQEPKTKHYHHLRYLSARQAIDLQKLSITGKPMSFVFVIREKKNIFLIWETYLSKEATYIWKLSAADDIAKKFELIQEMRKAKRMLYRTKNEDEFSFIVHDYKQPMNGFHKWKETIEEIFKTA